MITYKNIADENIKKEIDKTDSGHVLFFFGNGTQKCRVRTEKDQLLECTMYRDFEKEGDGIFWLMQRNACIKSSYSAFDRAMDEAFRMAPVIENGERYYIIKVCITENGVYSSGEVEAGWHRAKVFGNYSDAAVFEEI